jgi:hypothetical protein
LRHSSSRAIRAALSASVLAIIAACSDNTGPSQYSVQPALDNWITYGHDGHRTSASKASIKGPLKLAWHYVPPGATGHTLESVEYPLGTTTEVFVRSTLSINIGYGATPSVDEVSPSGQHVWTYFSGADADFGDWGSILGTRLIINDDGLRYVDFTTGKSVHGGGVDQWGETLTDSTGLYLANGAQIDGPGVYVGALDTAGKLLWSANKFATCRGSAAATAGGLALNNGVLFYAPTYNKGTDTTKLPYASGVYAFNATTGAQVAFQATTPYSRMSADNSHVYLVENQYQLVARNQSNLKTAWSATLTSASEQAPVLADGLVIIATSTGVEAYSPSSGAPVWKSAALTGADAHWSNTYQGGNCGDIIIPVSYGPTTTMAAALASKTLVVVASDGFHILSLSDGTDLWHGAVTGVPTDVGDPIIVNDPSAGPTIYVVDYSGMYAVRP